MKLTNDRHNLIVTTAVLLLAAIVLAFPIYYFGVPGGNDLPQHFRFAYTFYEALHNGEIYPSWPANTNAGFGDVGIRFYPPLTYYSIALFRLFSDSWTTVLAATIGFWFFIGGLGARLLAREFFSEKASVACGLIFMAMPYHANQVYNAGLLAEFVGLAILPFCFAFVTRITSEGKWRDVVSLSISFGLLILAHLPMAIMGSFGLLIYSIALLERKTLAISILKLGSSIAIALLASSFYWVRMISELTLVRHSGPEFTDSRYDFRLNFLGSIFYIPSDKYADTSLWFTDLLFAITLAMIIPALTAFLLVARRPTRRKIIPFLAVLVGTVIISTPLSVWLWASIDLLGKIQFPWRFLGLISLAGSVIIAGFIDQLSQVFTTGLRPVGLVAVGLIVSGLVFTGAQVIRPANYSTRAEFDKAFERYRTDESYECWWPIGASRQALTNRERVSVEGRSVELQRWIAGDRMIVLSAGSGTDVRIATFYYPFWKAAVNGNHVDLQRLDDGTIGVNIPSTGASGIRLYFEPPIYETASRYASLCTWLVLLSGLTFGLVKSARRHKLA